MTKKNSKTLKCILWIHIPAVRQAGNSISFWMKVFVLSSESIIHRNKYKSLYLFSFKILTSWKKRTVAVRTVHIEILSTDLLFETDFRFYVDTETECFINKIVSNEFVLLQLKLPINNCLNRQWFFAHANLTIVPFCTIFIYWPHLKKSIHTQLIAN